ncbi:hypothetical protein ACJMK2_012271, partial [Sinanodonta woodiana]
CFKNLSHFTTRHNLSDKNDPRHCFEECNNAEYIALQTQECFCNATPGAYATERDCSNSCHSDKNFWCGSNNATYVYYTEQPTIDVDGEFGFVYLHVFHNGVSFSYVKHVTNNITERRNYICYNDLWKCEFTSPGVEKTWQEAKSECLVHNQGLAPFNIAIDERICTPKFTDGFFWIGMSWIKPVNTSTTTTSTSTTTLTSSTATSTSTAATSTLFTTSEPAPNFITTIGLRSNHTSDTLQTSNDYSSDGRNVIAVAVPVVAAVLAVLVVLICWKRNLICFKPRHARVQTGKINSDSSPAITYMDPVTDVNVSSSIPSGSNRATFHVHQDNIRPIVSLQAFTQEGHYLGSNAEKYEREMGNSTPNHLEGRSERTGHSFEPDDGINSSASKTVKGKGKRKKKKNKQLHEMKGYPNDKRGHDEEKRTENENEDYLNEEQRSTSSTPFAVLDPNIQFDRCTTATDIHATVPTVQDEMSDYLHGSSEVYDALHTNNSESRIEETETRKRKRKRKKRNKITLFDVPADRPVLEWQTDINNIQNNKQNENRKKDKS